MTAFKRISLYILIIIISFSGIYGYGQKNNKKNSIKLRIEKEAEKKLDSMKQKTVVVKSAPIAPFRDTLFYIYGNMGSFTPEQRAKFISERIYNLGKDDIFISDSMKLTTDGDDMIDIVYKDMIIMGINDIQAIKQNNTKEEVAKEYKNTIIKSVEKYRSETSWQSIAKRIGLTALVIIATYFILRFFYFCYRRTKIFIFSQQDKRIKGISTLIDAEKTVNIIISIINFIRIILSVIILYLCLLAIFNIYPSTKNISETLLSYIINPLRNIKKSIINYLPNLFSLIIIFIIFKYLRKSLYSIALKIRAGSIKIKGFYPDWAITTYNIVNIILYIFMFIIMFPYFPGSNSPIFQGVSVFMGILFSLGSTSLIGNAVSGIVITYMRSFRVGDRIKIGEFIGNVVEKTPLVTRIKTPKNELITIPNSSVMSSQTINYTSSAKEHGLVLYCTVTFGYETPWRKVHELLLEAASRTSNILTEPKPFILQTALNDFYAEYQLNVYTKKANEMNSIYSDLNKNIMDVFNEAGLEMVAPHYSSHRDGNQACIPEQFLPKDYKPGAFGINIQNLPDKE